MYQSGMIDSCPGVLRDNINPHSLETALFGLALAALERWTDTEPFAFFFKRDGYRCLLVH